MVWTQLLSGAFSKLYYKSAGRSLSTLSLFPSPFYAVFFLIIVAALLFPVPRQRKGGRMRGRGAERDLGQYIGRGLGHRYSFHINHSKSPRMSGDDGQGDGRGEGAKNEREQKTGGSAPGGDH